MNKVLQRLSLFSIQQVALIGLAVGGFYYMTIFDSGDSIKVNVDQLKVNIGEEETKKKVTDENLAKEKQMRDLVGLLGKQFQEVSRKLPADLNSTELKRQLDSFARQSRIAIRSFEPMDERKVEIVNEIPANITIEGSYSQIAHFVDLVSRSEKVMSVRNVSMEPVNTTNQGPSTNRLLMTTQIVGYEMVTDDKPAVPPAEGVTQ